MASVLKRSAALLLALLMAFTFCACGDSGNNDGGDKAELKVFEGEQAILDTLGDNGLDGYEFKVVDFSDNHFNREKSGTPYYDAWQQAMDEVEGLYNCTITTQAVAPGELFNSIQPEIAAGGKYADLVITTQWAYGYLMGADLMLDLNKLDIDWDAPYWNQNIRRISTIKGETFAGNGSFIFDTAQTYMLYYNESIWNELSLPDPYELVRSGNWTQDLFAEYALKAKKDQDGNGVVDTTDDRWGVATPDGDFARAMFMGMGGHYYNTNAETGEVEIACNNDRTYSIVEKMYNMAQKDKSICTLTGSEWTEVVTLFTDGNALFLGNSPGVGELKNMDDDWGVMPMPKLNAEQESYYGCVDHNSSVFGVTSTNEDLRETSLILNALGLHCQTLEEIYWPDYQETYWRHTEDADIIAEYVVRTGQYDLAILMQNANATLASPMSRVFQCAFGTAGSDFSSYMGAAKVALQRVVDQVFNVE